MSAPSWSAIGSFGSMASAWRRCARASSVLPSWSSEYARYDSAPAFAYLAYSEQQLGRTDDARAHLRSAIALDPNDPMAKLLAATIR
jgi:hypothetical protein